jgi:hypothetical protein
MIHFREGVPVPNAGEDTVSVKWPKLDEPDWQLVLRILNANRARGQAGLGCERLPEAMQHLQALWQDRANPLWQEVLEALEICTGHSMGMLGVAMGLLNLISAEDLQRAANCALTNAVKSQFVNLPELPGKVRFFAHGFGSRLATRALQRFEHHRRQTWKLHRRKNDLILGYAAGNVPGTALLLMLLGLASAAGREGPTPAIVIKNSRREPLFAPLVLSAIESVDPTLVNSTMVTIWDYSDARLQEFLVGQADLVIAAASDETIASIDQVIGRVAGKSSKIRFHRHGHKVSFSTIGHECLAQQHATLDGATPLVEAVALLASLDVALWNQQGCLSSRVHFVETGTGDAYYSPADYGRAVVGGLRVLDNSMPKGVPRKRQIHNLFDKYQTIAASHPVEVLSSYDDDFLVVLDRRPHPNGQFTELVNDSQGRSVAIVPVRDIMEVPQHYLSQIRREHLQSMSVAVGDPAAAGLDSRLMRYAKALGAAGVTSIRTVGRGAFPQLAYSWDGLIPLDLVAEREEGHFTALEFGEPWAQIHETYKLISEAVGVVQG